MLVEGTDYEVSYRDNLDAGTATVVVTGIGNYRGAATKAFSITRKDLSGASVALSKTSYVYTGIPALVGRPRLATRPCRRPLARGPATSPGRPAGTALGGAPLAGPRRRSVSVPPSP